MTSAEYLSNLEPSCRVSCFVRTPEKLAEVIEAIDPFEDTLPCWSYMSANAYAIRSYQIREVEQPPTVIKGCSGGPEGKWEEVQAIQHQPFVFIMANGSKWAGEEVDGITELLKTLANYRLAVERFDNSFYTVNPCRAEDNPKWSYDNPGEPRWIDGERLYACDGVVRFFGNFENVSHVFDIDTNHKPTIDALMAAIEQNAHVVDRPETK